MMQNEPPGSADLWGFILGSLLLFISVDPFTDIVANYACHNRNEEC